MLSIKNNLMAENAARYLGKSYDNLSKSVERLSSGLRINSSKDDAAGLAVRELIRADVAKFQQASRNARDAVSMLQTAEGALAAMNDILVRMEELAEQASTESYSSDQRGLMNDEFTALKNELDRIVQNTSFNEINLLNDSSQTYEIHLGTASTITIDGADLSTSGTTMNLGGRENFVGPAASSKTGVYMTGGTGDAIEFTFDDGTTQTAMEIDVTSDMTLLQVKSAINALSQATSYEYDAASIVYDGTSGQYHLKVEAPVTGNLGDTTGVTVTETTGITWGAAATGLSGETITDSHFQNNDGSDGGDLSDVDSATSALTAVQNAIKAKDEYRAKLGYLMNRLEQATNVVDIQAENLKIAESRVSDVDVATEMSTLTRNQVLAQAGISMLAQANAIPQMALSLLSR